MENIWLSFWRPCPVKNINVPLYKQFCTNLNSFLDSKFPRVTTKHLPRPWISITKTLHKVLAHSWQLIENNDGFSCNKTLRNIHRTLSRKTSQQDNLTDCLRRMWLISDPIVDMKRCHLRPKCKTCFEYGHFKKSCPTILKDTA